MVTEFRILPSGEKINPQGFDRYPNPVASVLWELQVLKNPPYNQTWVSLEELEEIFVTEPGTATMTKAEFLRTLKGLVDLGYIDLRETG